LIGAGRDLVRAQRPDVRVGVKATFGDLSEPRLRTLSASHDARYVTYYVAGNFEGTSQGSLASDLTSMLGYAAGKPLVLKECGHATGPRSAPRVSARRPSYASSSRLGTRTQPRSR
jgi:hypothetical protein